MSVVATNCKRCPEYENKKCSGETAICICKRCPRNLGVCLTTRYCRETESTMS